MSSNFLSSTRPLFLHHVVVCLFLERVGDTIKIDNVSLKCLVMSLHRVPHVSVTDFEPQSLGEGWVIIENALPFVSSLEIIEIYLSVILKC